MSYLDTCPLLKPNPGETGEQTTQVFEAGEEVLCDGARSVIFGSGKEVLTREERGSRRQRGDECISDNLGDNVVKSRREICELLTSLSVISDLFPFIQAHEAYRRDIERIHK